MSDEVTWEQLTLGNIDVVARDIARLANPRMVRLIEVSGDKPAYLIGSYGNLSAEVVRRGRGAALRLYGNGLSERILLVGLGYSSEYFHGESSLQYRYLNERGQVRQLIYLYA